MSKLAREISKPLSNIDLQKLLNEMNEDKGKNKERINIFTVPEMNKNPNKFLKKIDDDGYSILFINPNNVAVGHWVVHYKNRKTGQHYFFDSYGKSPAYYDKELVDFYKKYIPNIKYNTEPYQKKEMKVNTCGRYATLIGLGLNNIVPDLTPEKIKEIMERFKKTNKMDYDEIVTRLINFDL